MPGWTPTADRERIAARLGVDPTAAEFLAAVEAAERRVEEVTGLVWGRTEAGTVTVRLDAPAMEVAVPLDVRAVTGVTPEPPGTPEVVRPGTVALVDGGEAVPWPPERWELAVTRGITDIPERVIEAVALLTAQAMGVPDPGRSRYAGGTFGARGGYVQSRTGVPEADGLLAAYLSRPAMDAV